MVVVFVVVLNIAVNLFVYFSNCDEFSQVPVRAATRSSEMQLKCFAYL